MNGTHVGFPFKILLQIYKYDLINISIIFRFFNSSGIFYIMFTGKLNVYLSVESFACETISTYINSFDPYVCQMSGLPKFMKYFLLLMFYYT